MSDYGKLPIHAANIMAHLEDAGLAAMEIQGQDKSISDITHKFEIIRNELQTINKVLANVVSDVNAYGTDLGLC